MQLPSPQECGTILLVSGWRKVGKTTLLLTLRAAAHEAGLRVGGFLSVARVEDGAKTGIDLLDAATGDVVPLADYHDDTSGADDSPRTRHYVFNPAALDVGLRYAAAGQAADMFFVDELGPLELERGEGWAAVIDMVAARAFGVALVVVRPELVAAAREQMDLAPDSPLVTVSAANRAALAGQLAAWIAQRASCE